jgi:dTDP-4-amino-4,6-dideoxygalactose transaminase
MCARNEPRSLVHARTRGASTGARRVATVRSVPVAVPHTTLAVTFVDLTPSHAPLKEQLLRDIGELIDTGAFTNGSDVAELERAFASFCEVPHCVGVASGLDALRLVLQALELEPGDEVILPANTFIATAAAVTQAGGVPVLADVRESDYNLDPDAAAAAISARTRCLLPVHLYGQLADMCTLAELAHAARLELLEDACQAHGAMRDGLGAGAAGVAAAFSFYPGKNLGAFGDAGALVTWSAAIAGRVRTLREHGQRTKYAHDVVGWTSRLDTIQALVLIRKLPKLRAWNEQRRAAAAYYLEALDGVGDLRLPPVAAGSEPVWHLFVIRTANPESLAAHLHERGIATGRHYPRPVHLAPAYEFLRLGEGAFPVAERIAHECLSLPVFPGITDEQLAAVCSAVEGHFTRD